MTSINDRQRACAKYTASARSLLLALGLTAGLIGTATTAHAQERQPDGRVVYPASWFERFTPTDALAMALQAPGFTIENGEEVRGFGGAAGNVIINGERPSGKSLSLEETLRRIPASQVERLELLPGELAGSEYRTRAQVLNVVLRGDASGMSGSVSAGTQIPYTGVVTPFGSASVLYRRGDHSFNAALDYEANTGPDEGWDELRELPSRDLIERRDKVNRYEFDQLSLTGSWQWAPEEGRGMGVNGRIWSWRNPLDHVSNVSNDSGPLRVDTIDQRPTLDGVELGVDVTAPFSGGTGRVVVLGRREQRDINEVITSRSLAGDLTGGLDQSLQRELTESIARTTWSREDLMGWRFEAGGEIALNTLDSHVELAQLLPGGGQTPIALPTADVEVREVRHDLFASAGRALSDTLQFDMGLAVERSNLTVSGDTDAERTLTFWKPSAALEWRPTEAWRARVAAERQVAQLVFDDFISSAELANDRVNAGNPDIEPERTWRLSALIERKFWGDGQLRATFYYDAVEAVQDRIPTDVGFDAPGNLGDGRRVWADVVLDMPLERVGVHGGRFSLHWIVQDSSVEDPYTGRDRHFSGESPWFIEAGFQQVIESRNLTWGVDYVADGGNPNFRLNEIDTFSTEPTNFAVYVELRPAPGLTANLRVENILDRDIYRERVFYSPDRSSLVPVAVDERWRTQGPIFTVTLTKTFG